MVDFFYCNNCDVISMNMIVSGYDGRSVYCPSCGEEALTKIDMGTLKDHVHKKAFPKNTPPAKSPMTLVEFSEKLLEYEKDLSPCPFCKSTNNLSISIITIEDSDSDIPWKAVRISCDCCNLSYDSPVFPEALAKENKYEEALSAVANHCRAWDIRGEDIED